jgi:hypothetical protein
MRTRAVDSHSFTTRLTGQWLWPTASRRSAGPKISRPEDQPAPKINRTEFSQPDVQSAAPDGPVDERGERLAQVQAGRRHRHRQQ